jgi:hypothetical protein
MHVKDESIWLASKADMSSQGEQGAALIQFVEDWCDRAEWAMIENEDMRPVQALYLALPAAEAKHGGAIHPNHLIQALMVIVAVWGWANLDPGDPMDDKEQSGVLMEQLSPIEHRIISAFVGMEQQRMEEQAQTSEIPPTGES